MSAEITKAISVHAPYAWALMYGGKDVENRSLNFPRRSGGVEMIWRRVWVHASMWPGAGPLVQYRRGAEDFDEACDAMARLATYEVAYPLHRTLASFPEARDTAHTAIAALRGHIIGSIEVYGYRTPDNPPDSPWYVPGSLAIMVRDPRPLATPVLAKGSLGWWTPTEDVMAQLELPA